MFHGEKEKSIIAVGGGVEQHSKAVCARLFCILVRVLYFFMTVELLSEQSRLR